MASHRVAGLRDRLSVPAHSPRRTPARVARRVCALRRRTGFGPHRLARALGMARSTVYAVLRRAGLQRLDRLHRVTRHIVRYEYPRAGDLLHLDVKKLGRIPPGGWMTPHSSGEPPLPVNNLCGNYS